jgi:hypothetical protein
LTDDRRSFIAERSFPRWLGRRREFFGEPPSSRCEVMGFARAQPILRGMGDSKVTLK